MASGFFFFVPDGRQTPAIGDPVKCSPSPADLLIDPCDVLSNFSCVNLYKTLHLRCSAEIRLMLKMS